MFRRAEVAPRAVRERESPTAFRGFFFFPRVILKLCPEGHKKSKEGCAKGFCRGARAVPGVGRRKSPRFQGVFFSLPAARPSEARTPRRGGFWGRWQKKSRNFRGVEKVRFFCGEIAGEGACGLSAACVIWGPRPAAAARHGAGDARKGGHLYLYLEFSSACGCCPARAAGRLPGVGHGVRGAAAPLHPLHPRTPLFAVTRKQSL